MAGEWYVYLLRCGDGSQYAGIAKDVDKRLQAHEAGTGARYTRGRGPLELLASVGPFEHGDALRLELRVKRAPAAKKSEVLEGAAPSESTAPAEE